MPVAVEIVEPLRATSPVVFASPHSGRVYPADFLSLAQVPERVLRSSEDAYVDRLIADAPEFGAPLVTSQVPRAYVDFNRAADEFDPALIDGVPRAGLNPRIASGLGVIARVVANGRAIYRGKLPRAEAERRIARYWQPYHAALAGVLAKSHARFGQVLLCDRWGAAARVDVVEAVEEILTGAGFTVARNTPFAGAYVAQRYGQPSQGMHAVQIEIDRALYLDEHGVQPLPGFESFRAVMRDVVRKIAALDLGGRALDLAAE